jgi:hypothetical protein
VDVLAGPFIAAAALLGLAGAGKLRRPAPTGAALRALGLPGGPLLVRAGAAVEVVVAAGAVTTGNRLAAALVAASYLGFTVFVLAAMRRNVPLSSCGCFGRPDTPPSPAHVAVNLTFAAVAASVAGAPVGGLARILDGQPMLGIPFLALTAVSVALAYLSLTLLPALLALASGRSQ